MQFKARQLLVRWSVALTTLFVSAGLLAADVHKAVVSLQVSAHHGMHVVVSNPLFTLQSAHTTDYYKISFTAQHTPHYFFLTQPQRLVIDLPGTLQHAWHKTYEPTDAVQQIRYAARDHQHTRLVFELQPKWNINRWHMRCKSGQLPTSCLLYVDVKSSVQHPVAHGTTPLTNHHQKQTTPMITAKRRHTASSHVVKRPLIIVIDPGHGGKDPGATGADGTHEKDVVLRISTELLQDINRHAGFKARLTRHGDYYLKLRQRLGIARHDHADMFIAIHADEFNDPRAHGVSVFALSSRGATSEAARWLAVKENASELVGGVSLNDKSAMLRSVLINLSQNATISTSIGIGQNIIQQVKPFAHLHQHRVDQAAFVVLKSPDIPSLLVEVGFLSNRQEELRLINPVYQQRMALAISRGIMSYFTQHPKRVAVS